MKTILKYICICLLVSACSSLPRVKQHKNFVVLHTNDTVFGKKIRFTRGVGKIGKVKVVNENADKQIFTYDKIYQVHHYRKNNNYYVEEMVALTPNNSVSLTLMDVVINEGSIKLYQHDPTNWGNTDFVVSDFFHGYVRTQKEFNSLLSELNKCVAFRGKFSEKSQKETTQLKKLLQYYNTNCN